MRAGQEVTVTFTSAWGSRKQGEIIRGTVLRVFRARSGAVLATVRTPDGREVSVPVSKYVKVN